MKTNHSKKFKKYKKFNIKAPSKWLIKAKFREENQWLRYSSKIAGRILAAIEDDNELTQVYLAEKIGVKPQQIHKIVKGQQNLTLKTIHKLAEALKTELISFPAYKDSFDTQYFPSTKSAIADSEPVLIGKNNNVFLNSQYAQLTYGITIPTI
jgi:transcriptional regulator with XRE-family HTH domain